MPLPIRCISIGSTTGQGECEIWLAPAPIDGRRAAVFFPALPTQWSEHVTHNTESEAAND